MAGGLVGLRWRVTLWIICGMCVCEGVCVCVCVVVCVVYMYDLKFDMIRVGKFQMEWCNHARTRQLLYMREAHTCTLLPDAHLK